MILILLTVRKRVKFAFLNAAACERGLDGCQRDVVDCVFGAALCGNSINIIFTSLLRILY